MGGWTRDNARIDEDTGMESEYCGSPCRLGGPAAVFPCGGRIPEVRNDCACSLETALDEDFVSFLLSFVLPACICFSAVLSICRCASVMARFLYAILLWQYRSLASAVHAMVAFHLLHKC